MAEKTAATGFPNYPLFARDPFLDRIRQTPAFIKFMNEQKVEHEKYRHEFGDKRFNTRDYSHTIRVVRPKNSGKISIIPVIHSVEESSGRSPCREEDDVPYSP